MDDNWLIFLPQVPAAPSSLRVLVWRRLRAAGAVGLQHGTWVLPRSDAHATFLQALLAEITAQGGMGTLFTATPLDPAVHDLIRDRNRADRDAEYAEVCERAQGVLDEIANETTRQKFTFAELEEIEQDVQKLAEWLVKITARDFFSAASRATALMALDHCRTGLRDFAHAVYAHEGMLPPEEPASSHEEPQRTGRDEELPGDA